MARPVDLVVHPAADLEYRLICVVSVVYLSDELGVVAVSVRKVEVV
jgi:hypothetical protein